MEYREGFGAIFCILYSINCISNMAKRQNRSTSKGVGNFFRVAAKAVFRPTRIFTGLLAGATAAALPAIAVPALVGGGVAILAMSWSDINDPEFIQQALAKGKHPEGDPVGILDHLLGVLQRRAKQQLHVEVSKDIKKSATILGKIVKELQSMSPNEIAQLDFVIEQTESVVKRLLDLLTREEKARNYLESENIVAVQDQLTGITSRLEGTKDKVTRQQLTKARDQLELQIKNYEQMDVWVERIDAYIANIRSVLRTTYSNMTKLQLRDNYISIDETDVLAESMKSIVDEIDANEELQLGISLKTCSEDKADRDRVSAAG